MFGGVLARALDTWWHQLGRPDPYFVIEAGAGAGTLAASVLAAAPACAPALRYVLVERSATMRERQGGRLPIEPARQVLGPALAPEPGEAPEPAPGSGPVVTSLGELPAGPLVGVVLANELLDNLPFRLLERTGGWARAAPRSGEPGWAEVRVSDDLAEVLVPASPQVATEADRLAPHAPGGARVPLQHRAGTWLSTALGCIRKGRVVAIDYADTTASLARRPWSDWVRTYRAHGRGGPPLSHLGHQDVTCELAVDQLGAVRGLTANTSQADFLRAYGLDDLAAGARRTWEDRAAIGDLQAMKARSQVAEAVALTDPRGLGEFRVLEWTVGH